MPRDTRPFITVHDGMPEHPKIEPLSDAAFRLLVTLWCWSSRSRTDGRVTLPIWTKRGRPKTRQELVDAGLVEVDGDHVLLHDYLEHQRSAAEIEELSEKRREAGKKGAKAKANAAALAKHEAEQTPSNALAEQSRAEQLTTVVTTERGQRRETLPPASASKPPPDDDPNQARCTAHAGVATPPPCLGCKNARETAQAALDRDRDQAEREHRAAAEAAARACTRCDGTWVIDPATTLPTRHRCDHRRTA